MQSTAPGNKKAAVPFRSGRFCFTGYMAIVLAWIALEGINAEMVKMAELRPFGGNSAHQRAG